MNNENYVKTVYRTDKRPRTTYPDELIDYLIKRFGIATGSSILDSGCGRGDFAQAFVDRGMNVVGIDGSNANDESSYRRFGGVDLEKEKLPFNDEQFDVVFSKSVLEHIHRPEKYLTENYRVLKRGGCLILLVPDWHSQMFIYYDDFSHVQPYTVSGVNDVLEIFGYGNVCSEIFYQLPCVWRHKSIRIICKLLQILGGPVKTLSKNKFYRFSRELMILGVGYKE